MSELYNPWRDHINSVMEGDTCLSTQDCCDILEYMDREIMKAINLADQVKQLNSIIRQLESLARAAMGDMGNKREPLTIAQIKLIVGDVHSKFGHMQPTPEIIVRAIERAHGIGA